MVNEERARAIAASSSEPIVVLDSERRVVAASEAAASVLDGVGPGGRLAEEVEIGGIILRHEAARGEPRPEMSGHFHPKLRVSLSGRSVSRRCFVVSATKLILPAFGALAGGLDAHHPEIIGNVGPGAAALVPVSDRLLRFPLAA